MIHVPIPQPILNLVHQVSGLDLSTQQANATARVAATCMVRYLYPMPTNRHLQDAATLGGSVLCAAQRSTQDHSTGMLPLFSVSAVCGAMVLEPFAINRASFLFALVAWGALEPTQHEVGHAKSRASNHLRTSSQTFFHDATTFLQVSSDRTLSFRPPGIVAVGNVATDDVLRDVDMDTPDAFVQGGTPVVDIRTYIALVLSLSVCHVALLGFPHALDPHWTQFGPYPIRQSEVFYTSTLSVGLVNLKPIVPGHVLVIPKRRVARFLDLDGDEVADLWHAAQVLS
ncbi:hypothetical protein DYB36_005841 [Aphanomyces astaci]|uniref:HIT domain-containing protein n=1 Tax=Aphanomyces astaci TaxID=112090 RepID=A0A397BF40_APHAT|nr:hypothetical protein DYB36_005841 [Aphanomyces astaci]